MYEYLGVAVGGRKEGGLWIFLLLRRVWRASRVSLTPILIGCAGVRMKRESSFASFCLSILHSQCVHRNVHRGVRQSHGRAGTGAAARTQSWPPSRRRFLQRIQHICIDWAIERTYMYSRHWLYVVGTLSYRWRQGAQALEPFLTTKTRRGLKGRQVDNGYTW